MRSKDKALNRVQDSKGQAKESVGSATGNETLRNKGKTDQSKAALKGADEKLKDAASHVKDRGQGPMSDADRAEPASTSELNGLPGSTRPVTIGWTMKSREIVGSSRSEWLLAQCH